MICGMKNIIGGGDSWASNTDGTVQVKIVALGDTTVSFNNVPDADYGYELWIDMDYSAGAQATPKVIDPIKRTVEYPTVTVSGGVRTVTYTIKAVNANQVGAHCQLRLVK